MDTASFFSSIFSGYSNPEKRWIELRMMTPGKKGMDIRWFPITDTGIMYATRCAQDRSGTMDVYYGVLPRTKTHGVKDSVAVSRVLFAEIDGASGGMDGALRLLCTAIAEQRIKSPSLMVTSGGGVHTYWRLSDTCVTEQIDMSMLLKRLCVAIGGVEWHGRTLKPIKDGSPFADPVSTDLPRILRVPGTWNHKPSRNCPVRMVDWFDGDAPISVAQWDALLPPGPSLPPMQEYAPERDTMTGLPPKTEQELYTGWPIGQRWQAIRKILYVGRKRNLNLDDLVRTFCTNNPGAEYRDFDQLVRSTLTNVYPDPNYL